MSKWPLWIARGWLRVQLLSVLVGGVSAVELEDARKKLIAGDYRAGIQLCEQAIKAEETDAEWRCLLVEAQLTLGRYNDALKTLNTALAKWPMSANLRLRLLGREVFLFNNLPDRAREMLQEINQLATTRTWAYRDPQNLLILGQTALLLGADPKLVLDKLYDPAKKANPNLREVYLTSGGLALAKNDFDLAAKTFKDGLKKFPEDPDVLFGYAKSFSAGGDRRPMLRALMQALEHNTNHIPSLLLMADHLVDAEEYPAAEKILAQVLTVNPAQPEAWAYRAVLAHLKNDANGEKNARETALKHWTTNPHADHLIGLKLSQKYRFNEGAAHQRQALKFNGDFLPAKSQLAQDLLRLGQEEEGWTLLDEVHTADGYDVTAFNLVTLKDGLAKFATLTNADFIVRMSAREAAIYGPRVLALLARAKTNLSAKYGLTLDQPTTVEIFPDQKDFGVRTFGMPGNPGYLGVCFGHVITANSPASQAGHPANWEAVLWHEFCHVITLTLTRNKMPRWLSEGISVHEELQANPVWGQAMNPKYREMVLSNELAQVSELSGAFLAPKSDLHLQFAYYESALVVEFLVQKFGQESLTKILRDLGEGKEINETIAKHTAPLDQIEKDFAAFARARAEQLAPELEWEKPSAADLRQEDGPAAWAKAHPKNFHALTQQAKLLLRDKQWEEAKAPLKKLLAAYPAHTGADNAYELLAAAHRGLGETNLEREVLTQFAARTADGVDTYLRLMELDRAAQDWTNVVSNAERYLAVNPLVAPPHRHLARALEELGRTQPAIEAYRTVLLLDPPDPADAHFRLAKLLHQTGDASARRHLLQALEEAPRFRDAQRLLVEMVDGRKP